MSITSDTTTRPSTWSWEEWCEVLANITKAYRGIKGKAPITFNQDPNWRWVVNIMYQLLSPAKGHHYPLNRGMVELHIWSGCLWEAKYLFLLPQLTRRFVYLTNPIATPTNLKNTHLNSKRNFIPYLLLLTSSIMKLQNSALVFKRAFGNRFIKQVAAQSSTLIINATCWYLH
jgi:hypothetical protein